MKLETKIIKFFNEIENTVEISKHTNKYLLERYYNSIRVDENLSQNDWFIGLAENRYPFYSNVEKAIKIARNTKDKWKKEY